MRNLSPPCPECENGYLIYFRTFVGPEKARGLYPVYDAYFCSHCQATVTLNHRELPAESGEDWQDLTQD
jgi:hypothetical protein